MANSYLRIENDNGVVVIDDTYSNPCFVHRSELITVQASDERKSGSVGWANMSDGMYGKYETYSRVYTLEELGLKSAYLAYIGIRRVDAMGGGATIVSSSAVYSDSNSTQLIGIRYRIYSMDVGAVYQIASFSSLDNVVLSKEGLQIFNANSEIVFDAARGYMQVMDSQYHIRDLFSSATQTFEVYNSHLPDVDYSKMFLISRQRPQATTGGTIITNYRQYVPRLRKDANNKIYVDLVMWGKTGGNRLQQYQRVFSFMVAHVHF